MVKLKADRLSDLPDSLIQHILSFLPSTRDAIRTGILSKRWRNQWRQVPFLTFTFLDNENHSKDIDNVLNQYECSKVDKLHISYTARKHPHFGRIIRFAVTRDVKEFVLEFNMFLRYTPLPESLFGLSSLAKLHIHNCSVLTLEKVNLKHLKEFSSHRCKFSHQAIGNILSGCPLLESLTLETCNLDHLVIASKSLRKLALLWPLVRDIGISCPNIEALCLTMFRADGNSEDGIIAVCDTVKLTAKGDFVVASDSLKKLVLDSLNISCLEISCPNLKELEILQTLHIKRMKVVNLESLVSATLDLELYGTRAKEILRGVQHVKELKIGMHFIWTALCNFYALEKLVVKMPYREQQNHYKYRRIVEDCWSRKHVSNGVPRNLKIVHITGLSEREVGWEAVVCFAQLLLENAQALEKMALTIEDSSDDFASVVSRKMSNVSWCSRHAVIEMFSRREKGWIKEVISKDA